MAQIIIYCDRLEFIPVNQVQSISGTSITPISGKTVTSVNSRNVKVVENQKHTAAGDLISQSLEVKYGYGDSVEANLINSDYVFKLSKNNGTTLLFGSLDNPAAAVCKDADGNGGKIVASRKTRSFEFV